jgi:hypothetical protein
VSPGAVSEGGVFGAERKGQPRVGVLLDPVKGELREGQKYKIGARKKELPHTLK